MKLTKLERKKRLRKRIRKVIKGSSDRPRLLVYRSNKEIYAQIIDDFKGVTVVSASSRDKGFKSEGNRVSVAFEVGKLIGSKALESGIKTISFDRGGSLYHGRVKSLAEGAREAGLKF